MIISGERRYKAHLYNEAKTIKAHIVNVSDEAVEELTLIENIQRNDLTDFETAKHIVKLWESGRYEKKSDLAKKIGKPDSYVSKAFSCLKLDNEILEDIEANKKDISIGVMDEIARVKDKEVQKEVYEKYSAGEITRDEIKEFKEPKKIKKYTINDINETEWEGHKSHDNDDMFYTHKKDRVLLLVESSDLRKFNLEIYDDSINKNICYQVDTISAANKNLALTTAYKKYPNEAKDESFRFEVTAVEEEKFPTGKSYNEELNDANKLENQFTQLIEDGYRSPHPKIKLNNAYEIIIYRLLLQKSSKEVDNKFNKINTWLNNSDGRIQDSSKRKLLLSDECCTSLDNRYDEIIFDLLKENLELKKEIEELKKSSNESQTQEPIKDDEPITIKSLKDEKEIALLELLKEAVVIHYTNYDIDMGIDYKEAKKIIDKSKQDSIPFNVGKGTDERAYRLINTDIRTIKDDCIVFINKKNNHNI